MNTEVVQIASRIRELRDILDITVEEMAEDTGISQQDYLAYESGETDIPISALYTIAHKLGVDFTVLLTGESPRMETHCVVRGGNGVEVERYAGYKFNSLAFNYKDRTMEPMLVTLEPDGKQHDLVSHSGQEFNYVTRGTVRVTVGARHFDLNAGDSIYFDPRIPHGQMALGDEQARFLTVIQE